MERNRYKKAVTPAVSVSGYLANPSAAARVWQTAEDFGRPPDKMARLLKKGISSAPPERDFIDSLIQSLCRMVEPCYLTCVFEATDSRGNEPYYAVRNYICGLNASNISAQPYGSVLLIGHLIKRRSVTQYANFLRIGEAKTLLEEAELPLHACCFPSVFR